MFPRAGLSEFQFKRNSWREKDVFPAHNHHPLRAKPHRSFHLRIFGRYLRTRVWPGYVAEHNVPRYHEGHWHLVFRILPAALGRPYFNPFRFDRNRESFLISQFFIILNWTILNLWIFSAQTSFYDLFRFSLRHGFSFLGIWSSGAWSARIGSDFPFEWHHCIVIIYCTSYFMRV